RARPATPAATEPPRAAPPKKRLSYLEQREYEQIEQRIAEAEARLGEAQARLQAPETVCDPAKLEACWQEVRAAQEEVDRLYARWAELEAKLQ
ncbi:MAG: ABC transporter C-terminal domain-containing protein, partial [Bryobacteraceae bacterium]